jgi:glycosyltransferase involved in cell wall biosynthesis
VVDVAVVILTFNEAKHIGRCIESVKGFAREIFVVDSFSTDETVAIAREHGATVLTNPFVNYARQFQWALDNSPINAAWIMRLDADEIVEPDLAAEIVASVPSLPADVVGINLKRKLIFFDRWIRHGGRYPIVLLRLWRAGHGRIEDRWMDEHIVVWGGRTVTLQGGLCDHNLNDLTFFIEKHNRYATREALDVINQNHQLFARDDALSRGSSSLQASRKRITKEKIFNRVPFWLGSTGYFISRYFFQLGFLDGVEGLIYHFLQGYWYRFLVGAKIREFERSLARCPTRELKLAELERLTGYPLR